MSGPTSEHADTDPDTAPRWVPSQGSGARQWRIRPMAYEPPTTAATVVAALPAVPVVQDLTPDPALPDRARRVLRFVAEVLDGRRSVDQLAPLLSAPALRYLRALTAERPTTTTTARTGSQVQSVRVAQPTAHAAEVAARIRINGRDRALAARFDRPAGSWSCTTLRLL